MPRFRLGPAGAPDERGRDTVGPCLCSAYLLFSWDGTLTPRWAGFYRRRVFSTLVAPYACCPYVYQGAVSDFVLGNPGHMIEWPGTR